MHSHTRKDSAHVTRTQSGFWFYQINFLSPNVAGSRTPHPLANLRKQPHTNTRPSIPARRSNPVLTVGVVEVVMVVEVVGVVGRKVAVLRISWAWLRVTLSLSESCKFVGEGSERRSLWVGGWP